MLTLAAVRCGSFQVPCRANAVASSVFCSVKCNIAFLDQIVNWVVHIAGDGNTYASRQTTEFFLGVATFTQSCQENFRHIFGGFVGQAS